MTMNGPPQKKKGTEDKTLGQLRETGWKMTNEHYMALGRELSGKLEGFPFPGIDPEALERIRQDEKQDAAFFEEHPELRPTPIDELIKKLDGGIRVVVGDRIKGNMEVFVLPKGSDHLVADSVFPRHLKITDNMDPKLKELVLSSKAYKKKT